jgi:hypothetical protein
MRVALQAALFVWPISARYAEPYKRKLECEAVGG